jgi:aminoglycoside phosphotransferase (APT) family kinase protein
VIGKAVSVYADSLAPTGNHPAVSAWHALTGVTVEADAVIAITSKAKASVWRLECAAPSGSNVIAKRASRASAVIEQLIYETVIPQAGLHAPAYFGSLDDGDALWVFVEDAGDAMFSYDDPVHRSMAAVWLAQLHTRAAANDAAGRLPDRGPGHFRRRLDDAVHALQERLLEADTATREVVERLIDQCAVLAGRWPDVEAFCARLPRTIVHGDFAALNIRLRDDRIVAFDWEKAGLAVPVVDMARGLDLETYWQGVREAWPELTFDDVRSMALIARIFRPLSHNWARKTPAKLSDHHIHMQHTIETLGWSKTTGVRR